MKSHVVFCVGAIVHDRVGRLLLIQRGREPGRGLWSLPGGRVEAGESEPDALVREMDEETGLRVRVVRLVGRVHRPAPDGDTYDIGDYLCELTDPGDGSGALTPRAGDDADDARWVDAAEYEALPVVEGMREILEEWDALPPGWTGRQG
ncbi:MAG TPA: NUDIX domain-containing protein [Pseudonocardia sp.]